MFHRSGLQTDTWSYLLPFHETHLGFSFCHVVLHWFPAQVLANTQLIQRPDVVGTSLVKSKWQQHLGKPTEITQVITKSLLVCCRHNPAYWLSVPSDPITYGNHVGQTLKLGVVHACCTACPKTPLEHIQHQPVCWGFHASWWDAWEACTVTEQKGWALSPAALGIFCL